MRADHNQFDYVFVFPVCQQILQRVYFKLVDKYFLQSAGFLNADMRVVDDFLYLFIEYVFFVFFEFFYCSEKQGRLNNPHLSLQLVAG